MSGSIIAYAAAGVLGLSLLGWRFKQDPKTYGSAGWLKPWTAMRARLFKRKGILVGDWTGLLPVYYEDTHAISFGPSGSGKGTCTILPNLMLPGFAFAIDPGGENTAVAIKSWRKAGYEVCVINPFGMFGDKPWSLPRHGFNPLDILDADSETFASEALLIAELLIPRSGKEDGSSLYFKNAATSFLQAVLMHVISTMPKSECHLGTVYALVNGDADEWETLIKAMVANQAGDGFVSKTASSMERREEQAPAEFSAVMSTVQQDLVWLGDKVVRESLKRSDVDFSILKGRNKSGKPLKGGIISVVLPLEYNESHAAIPRLALGCAIWEMQRAPLAREKVLFLIDEAAALGKITRFPNWLATLRKYQAVLWPIFQNIGQVKALYGEQWQTFIANCGLRQFIGVSDLETAEYVSKLLGEQTTHSRSTNAQGQVSSSETRRALLTVDEILHFDETRQLVFIRNLEAQPLKKTPYWERPELRGRFNRNPYQSRKSPVTLGAGLKGMWGDLYHLLVCLLAPHPAAAFLYLGLLGVTIHKLIGVLS
ncbi:MAG: conjugal transfer protein TraG [Roseovarius sp.]|nr:conjugal transfer protein TraG [Roseovarius sp.]MBK44190.1 conjugal transfer protein TraG [Roseovarius sp.]|tara:strand:+ start:4621 stop:6240 length:1620 start_codon:yes stop_codon:yes gene_type:complete